MKGKTVTDPLKRKRPYLLLGFYMTVSLTIVMDIYLILRTLRSDLTDSNIVIIYAGNAHIKNYSTFLGNAFTNSLIYDSTTVKKCIKIPFNIIDKVYSITKNLKCQTCTYSNEEILNVLSERYEKENIEYAIDKTKKEYNIPERKVLKLVWNN